MKRSFFLYALMIVLFFTSIHAASLIITPASVNVTFEPGEQSTFTFTLQNTGSTPLTGITFNHTLPTGDNDGDSLTVRFSPTTADVPASGNTTITVTAVADNRLDFNDYKGTITASAGNEQARMDVTLSVMAEVCDFGIAGNDLIMRVEDPDENDDFEPGEEISIEVAVKNIGSRDIDVKVEAFLFGDEEEIVGASSEVMNVDDGDEEDFEFSLRIPVDSRRIESDKDYHLVIKAFDDDRERENCVQTQRTVEIQLENDKLIFDERATRFEPSAITCGEIATAALQVINIGDEDQENAYFTLRNAPLGINERVNNIDIDDFDSDENNIAGRRIQFTIPETARPGRYTFDATAHYNGDTARMSLPLEVLSCEGVGPVIANGAALQLSPSSFTAAPGDSLSIPVAIDNRGSAGIFSIEVQNFEEFAEPLNAPLVQLGSNQRRTVFVNLIIQDTADPARYSGSLLLLKNGVILDNKDFFVDIQPAVPEEQVSLLQSLWNAPLWFLIVLSLVILGALLVLVIALAW